MTRPKSKTYAPERTVVRPACSVNNLEVVFYHLEQLNKGLLAQCRAFPFWTPHRELREAWARASQVLQAGIAKQPAQNKKKTTEDDDADLVG